MNDFAKTVIVIAGLVSLPLSAVADASRDAILGELLVQAKQDDPSIDGFSAERGRAFYNAVQAGGKPETPSCATCHGEDPRTKGRTRAGKDIDPIAVSANPSRFTDKSEVEKWFRRNCKSVLGRECTATEKGDFITFLMGQ